MSERPSAQGPAATTAPPLPPSERRNKVGRRRWVLGAVGLVVVLVVAGVGAFFLLGSGDGTHRTVNPLEVRRLVATFACPPDRPGTPENLRLTAGQEVVQVPRAGCAVVGETVGRVDRLGKVVKRSGDRECTVTIDAPKEYGAAVDAAANVSDGQARALVAGGFLLDVRAVIDYPGRPTAALHVVFDSPQPSACDVVADALRAG